TGEALPPARRLAITAMLRVARRLPVVPLDDEAAGEVADAAAARVLQGRVRREVVARRVGTRCSCGSSRSWRALIRSVLPTPHRCPRPCVRFWSAVWTVWTMRPERSCGNWHAIHALGAKRRQLSPPRSSGAHESKRLFGDGLCAWRERRREAPTAGEDLPHCYGIRRSAVR